MSEIFSDFSRVVSPQTDFAGAVTDRFIYRSVSFVAYPLSQGVCDKTDSSCEKNVSRKFSFLYISLEDFKQNAVIFL